MDLSWEAAECSFQDAGESRIGSCDIVAAIAFTLVSFLILFNQKIPRFGFDSEMGQ